MVILENVKRLPSCSRYAEQNTEKPSSDNHDNPSLKLVPVFILCERCYWFATYIDTNRLLKEKEVDEDNSKICPRCDSIDSLSSLPLLSNESFNFNYTVKRGSIAI